MNVEFKLGDPRHPLWHFLRWLATLGFVLAVLALNANKFDESEIKVFIQIALGAIGLQMGHSALKKKAWQNDRDDTETP